MKDTQDAAAAMHDAWGREIYPGEWYYVTEDGTIFSRDSWRDLTRDCEIAGVVIEAKEERA